MIDTLNLLTTSQVAEFAAKGCLRFDGLIGSDLNQEFLDLFAEDIGSDDRYANRVIPNCKPGTYVSQAFPQDHPLSKILAQPVVAGTLKSLMGTNPIFDRVSLKSLMIS